MKKEEIIELGGKEYTVTLSREAYIRIDKYTNMAKSLSRLTSALYEYVDEVKDGINPFDDDLNMKDFDKECDERNNVLNEMIVKAFWIWLYPVHKLDKSKVDEIILPYINGKEKDFEFISDKYKEYLDKCIEIRDEYNRERKNLKAQTNKR